MELILLHPRLLERTCARCQRWLYDEQHNLVCRLGQPVPRPAGALLPCWKCPKRSPAEAAGCERDLDRILRTVRMYFEVRASAGRSLGDRQARDALLIRHLAIVDLAVRRLTSQHAILGDEVNDGPARFR